MADQQEPPATPPTPLHSRYRAKQRDAPSPSVSRLRQERRFADQPKRKPSKKFGLRKESAAPRHPSGPSLREIRNRLHPPGPPPAAPLGRSEADSRTQPPFPSDC